MQTAPTPTAETLDVRAIAPKHRFEAIMGTYRQLVPGEQLALTVDHDPECMYYTLLAEEGADAFTFQYLERGPEVWRVVVTCLRA